jgi:YD repeat-containing protein
MTVSRRVVFKRMLLGSLFVPLMRASDAFAQTVNYTYDELGRVKTVTYSNGATITYTYDAAGNRTQLTQVAGTPAPTGTFSVSPTSIAAGGSATLSWTSTNATSASIDNGVGAVTPVAGGSVSVSPTGNTTYTLTLTGAGGVTTLQAALTVTGGFNQTIQITGTGPVNLRTLADSAGYNGAQNATITFQVGAAVSITGAAGAPDGGIAIDTGTWPTSTYAIALTLQVSGKVYGGGGRGGKGAGPGNGANGGLGGDAVYCRLPMSITVNAGGEIKAGGGGAGGGGGRTSSSPEFDRVGGGGGGGFPNGAGGATVDPAFDGSDTGAANGAAGTTSGGGAGGSGETSGGGAGGAGGGAGANGVNGSAGSGSGTVKSPGTAGVAGYAVRKNGNTVTVTNNGTIVGTAA